MRVIGLNGSPREKGSTAYLLDRALKTARQEGAEAELIHLQPLLQEQKYPFCRACSSPCSGACYRGSSLEQVFQDMARADALIIGSPVYFGTVSAQLKGFWDKSRKLRAAQALLNTVGAAMTAGGARFGGQETALRALHDLMLVQGMILVGDGHDTADAGHQGCCAQSPASDDENAIMRAEILARRVVEVARVTSVLRQGRSYI